MYSRQPESKLRPKSNRVWLIPALLLAQTFGFAQWAAAMSFSDCGNGTACPYVTYGDGNSYSLMLNATLWNLYQGGGVGPGNPYYVPSTAGAIKNDVVVGTGASGTQVNTNFSGMDNAYPTPNDTAGTVFFTTNKTAYGYPPVPSGISAPADPGGALQFTGDTANTWDTTRAALSSFLGTGNTPIFFFNNNQVNSGASTNQDLAVWAQITLTDSTGTNSNLYFDFTNNGGPFSEPGGGHLNGDPTSYTSTGAGPTAGTNAATDYVMSGGQICLDASLNPQACDNTQAYTINNNLGANQAAYAVVFPELNNLLLQPNWGGYDSLSIDLRMGCDPNTVGFSSGTSGNPGSGLNCVGRNINNGYEQLFIASSAATFVPEPGTLALIGLGLVTLGFSTRKKAA